MPFLKIQYSITIESIEKIEDQDAIDKINSGLTEDEKQELKSALSSVMKDSLGSSGSLIDLKIEKLSIV